MKKKILFYGSNLLYFKSLIPIINLFLKKKNFDIYIITNSLNLYSKIFFKFIKQKKPEHVNIISKFTVTWISKLINQEKKFNLIKEDINFLNKVELFFFKKKFDCLVCTTKDLDEIKKYQNIFKKKIVIGYHHMPMVLGDNFENEKSKESSFFVKKNYFTAAHNYSFAKTIRTSNFFLNRFVYLNKSLNLKKVKNFKNVLIFHPGGYRNILTKPGESKIKSYEVQRVFIKKICIPLIKNNLKPILKIHPLHAMYHGKEDCLEILRQINLPQVEVVGPEENYYEYLKTSKFAISFGSSSSYELWSLGYKNIFYCNFFGDKRTLKFKFLKKQFFSSEKKYLKIILSKNLNFFFAKKYLKLFYLFKNTKNYKSKIFKLISS
jgi:hypothetical protein